MLVAIGPGQIGVPKKGRHFTIKDFPRGQVNGFADNLDIEKIKSWDRLKNNTAKLTVLEKFSAVDLHGRATHQTPSAMEGFFIGYAVKFKI